MPLRAVEPVGQGTDGITRQANRVDAFIDETLKAHQLSRAPEATRRTLIRRLSFDLTGLPPTPEEVVAFERDSRPDAYERLVDRLLASSDYGERWARWWLDLARYADTNGQDENKVMANAWRYRDWVVRAFAKNLPFDQFLTCQLAGDLMPTNGVDETEIFDRWTATGFLVLGPKMLAEQDKQKLVMDLVDEQIDVVSRSFLGLTVGCARCHDHKFDPVSTRDYYALAGIFKSTRTMANLDFVSRFNERCISTTNHLAAVQEHEGRLAQSEHRLAEAQTNAIRITRETGLREFPKLIHSALNSVPCPPGFQSNVVARIKPLVAPDPSTNSLSRTLRRLATDGVFADQLRQEWNEPHSSQTRLAPGKPGAAFLATGSNHLELNDSPDLEPEKISVELWMRPDEIPTEGETRRWLIGKNSDEWTQGHYALLLNKGQPGVYLNNLGGRDHVVSLFSDKHHLDLGEWHHLAFTYDGKQLQLFVDGQLAAERTVGEERHPGTGRLNLGRRPDGFVHFRGCLDEARVFNRVLSPAEVQAHVTLPEAPVGPGVVARWEFNELSDDDRESMARTEAGQALLGSQGLFTVTADSVDSFPDAEQEKIRSLKQGMDRLKGAHPGPREFTLAVEEGTTVDLPVHLRGSHLNLAKDPVARGFIQCVPGNSRWVPPTNQSGRLELARWMVSPENPLTARVIVNRLWQAHFGEGLVRTPDNFGVRGEHPSHPELLDALALQFMNSGWDIKAFHRLIVTSQTYRQQSGPAPTGDPENRWLSHFPRQRLEGEMVRDALMAVSGRMDRRRGGSLFDWKNDDYAPEDHVTATSVRRSLYLPVVRDRGYPVFGIFDVANSSVCTAKRTPTVVSHQALFFLNSPLVKETARALATQLKEIPGEDLQSRIRWTYERVLQRVPTPFETNRAERFLATASSLVSRDHRDEVWDAFCQTLLSANEFLYLD
jgi:Protein of unknown function (DUF1553)/Protein of unknown function (DUF1549)/Concanavalin A-like lectin/glucanases superfamily